MKMERFFLALCLSGLLSGHVRAQNISNPVIKGVADAGCVKYAGKYYLGGVGTDGDFFVSRDLVDWDNRIHVFDFENDWTRGTGAKNNQIHANDISYSGGLFHLLFSANYWGDDRHIVHITHATSPHIEGPYHEVREDQWYENRIDPQVFQDEDGRLYLYMVKFTDGNAIWGRPLHPDFNFADEAVHHFSSQPGTWETLDNRVAEGPFVIKYRGRYYMMYNANHTAPEYGNYHLGVCEASSPLAFNAGGKYAQPVVGPNTEPVVLRHTDLLRYGGQSYNQVNLKDSVIRFNLDNIPTGNIYMLIAQRGGCRVSLNGHAVNSAKSSEYMYYKVEDNFLRQGENIIRVGKPTPKASLSHLHLFDMGQDRPDEVLVTPGQPNIVRGPNGWEWWLVYMANQGWNRHQFVDRIHFVNNRLTVDGITSVRTPGFHPQPARPQYEGTSLDSLPKAESYLLEITSKRAGIPEEWRIERNAGMLTVWKNKTLLVDHKPGTDADVEKRIKEASADELVHVSFCEGYDEFGTHFAGWQGLSASDNKGLTLGASSVLKGKAHDSYALTAMFHNATPDRGRYGVIAAWADEKNHVRVGVDAASQTLIVENVVEGKASEQAFPLDTTQLHYPDIKYSDNWEKQYRFDSDTYVDAVLYPHLDASRPLYRDDMAGMMTLEYLDGATDKWMPVRYTEGQTRNRAWQKVEFPKVKTHALRMINKDPRQADRNIYRIQTHRTFAQDCQLRIEKLGRELVIFYGTRHITTLRLAKDTPARTGLFSDGQADVTVGNVLYYVR